MEIEINSKKFYIHLYENVEQELSLNIQGCMIDATMCCSIFHILLSIQKSFTTKFTSSIYSEIIHNLSPSRNIQNNLKIFQYSKNNESKYLLFITLEKDLQIKGKEIENLKEISKITNQEKLTKLFNLSKEELNLFESSFLSRCSIRDL